MAEIVGLAAHALLNSGRSDRAAVWIEDTHRSQSYLGTVAEAGGGTVPEEWKHLDVSLPLFQTLLESAEPVVVSLGEGSGVSLIGPLAGMSRAAWVPLRAQQRTFGLALAAYARPRPRIEAGVLQAVADELAIVLCQRRHEELWVLCQAALDSLRELQRDIARGAPADRVLARVAVEATRHARAVFVALGRVSAGPVRFEVFEGAPEWLSWPQEEPASEVWRRAMEEGQRIELSWEDVMDSRPRAERSHPHAVARVVAVPLEMRGERLGVLLAGLAPSSAPAAELEQLQSYASLAATALWQELHQTRPEDAGSPDRMRLDSSGEWILLVDQDGFVREASRSARQALGLERARVDRIRLEELFAASEGEAISVWRTSAAGETSRNSQTPPSASLNAVLPDGLTARLTARPAPAAFGLPEGCWEIRLEDVTALRAAEQKLGRVEAELRGLLDSLDSGVLMFDAAGRIRWMNDRFAQMLSLDGRRLADPGSFDSLVETISGHFREPLAFAARWRELHGGEGEAAWDELELMRPTRKVLERFARPVFDAAGNRNGWLEVYRDITSQRLIQSKMLQTEKMAALGQLVSGIAHELNNPLTSIMGYAQLLLGRRLGSERRDSARMIYEEAERAGRIVKNLLLFARETKPERRPVNLNEVVERTLALRSYELRIENINVEYDLDPDLPPTLADATQMQQVVLNLIVNAEQAIQHGRGSGHIRVRTRRLSPQRLALEVADDGPGIPPEIASRVFDPFFTTKPVGVGTGLGLSIVYGIVQEHGGEISLDSQPGCGATFIVELPIVAAPARAGTEDGNAVPPASIATTDSSETESLPPAGGQRVLVVEDEPTVARLIADVLRAEGHRVDVVLDSREGLERLSRQHFDLVVCDLRMPHVDGRAFYRVLARAGSPLQRRLVFVTGDTLAPHTLEFLDSTGLPYVAKPFLVEELKLAVQRAIAGVPAAARVVTAAGATVRPLQTARKQ